MSEDVLHTVSEEELQRQEAISELVYSEKNYVHSLMLVKEVGVWKSRNQYITLCKACMLCNAVHR